jgi:signal transduction histidine kinase
MKADAEFLELLAHRLGTPLAAVLGWTDLLLARGQDAPADNVELLLRRLQRELSGIGLTLRMLVDLGQPPALREESFSLLEVLMEVAAELDPLAHERGTRLSFDGVTASLRVHADRARVRDVVAILLRNVLDHAGVDVSAVVRVSNGGTEGSGAGIGDGGIRISICDDGVGFDEANPEGLGLRVARRLVEAHGSTLEVRSTSGQGTVAAFTLRSAVDMCKTL